MNVPTKLTQERKDIIVILYRSKDGLKTHEILYQMKSEQGAQEARIRGALTQFKTKGYLTSAAGVWKLSKLGEKIYENLDSITTQVRFGKEIKPPAQQLEKPYEPNLSMTAVNAANMLGAVIDDNNTYRNFMKEQLTQLAKFLGATITFPEEE